MYGYMPCKVFFIFFPSGLWIKEAEFWEQADIRFKHQVLMIVDTSSGPIVWSTNPTFNSLMENYLRVPLIKVSDHVYTGCCIFNSVCANCSTKTLIVHILDIEAPDLEVQNFFTFYNFAFRMCIFPPIPPTRYKSLTI